MTKTTIGVTTGAVAAAIAVGSASKAYGQEAVQWRIEDGGNGHWYAFHDSVQAWESARQTSMASGGHLVTITSPSEAALVHAVAGTNYWAGASRSNGVWTWITGEAWDYAPWNCDQCHASCQPDYPWENFLEVMCWDGSELRFNNWDGVTRSVIEWSADCNGDGIVDYGQIRAGELDDADGNNVPDCCEDGRGCTPCASDVVEDGIVNAIDLASVLSYWGTDGGKLPRSDVDGNGTVDALDLARVLSDWGPCP